MNNRNFKTSMCIMLVVSMLVFPGKVQAKIYAGVIEDKFKYTLDTEKMVMTFEGEGSFGGDYYTDASEVVQRFRSRHMRWVLGEGITRIKYMENPNFVTSFQLPQSLKTIDEYAFYRCRGLREIEIPSGVETIGKKAFAKCSTLRKVVNHSNQTVYLPGHPDFFYTNRDALPFNYYVDGELAVTVPPGKTAVGVGKRYRVYLERNDGIVVKGDFDYQIGEPLKLPRVKKKGYIFYGWTAKQTSWYAWYTISNEEATHDIYGSTLNWNGPQTLYAQFIKVTAKKFGRRKLKVGVPMRWRKGPSKLEIQYSTNKKFKKHQSIVVDHGQAKKIWINGQKKNRKKHYKLTYNKKKLYITFSKLKAKKTYYFRFRYSGGLEKPDGSELSWKNTGDWFKKSVKM